MSEETMTFVHKFLALLPGLGHIFAHYDRKSRGRGLQLDFVRGHWRPPLVRQLPMRNCARFCMISMSNRAF